MILVWRRVKCRLVDAALVTSKQVGRRRRADANKRMKQLNRTTTTNEATERIGDYTLYCIVVVLFGLFFLSFCPVLGFRRLVHVTLGVNQLIITDEGFANEKLG